MGGMFDREFAESLIIRDFDDALKNPFRYVRFSYYTHYYNKDISENRHAWPVTEGPKSQCYTLPNPTKERESVPYKMLFLVQPVPLIRNPWNLVSV